MKPLFFIAIFFVSMGYADMFTDTMQKVKEDAKEFRVYPRIQKAKTFIATGKDKEAQKLLKKVLSIDKTQKNAADMLVTLCMKHHNRSCVEKYVEYMGNQADAAVYLASISFADKEYQQAKKRILRIKKTESLNTKQRQQLLLMEAKIALFLKEKRLPTLLKKLKRQDSFTCSEAQQDIVSLMLENKQIKAAFNEIRWMMKRCQLKGIAEKKRITWAEILRDAHDYTLAQKLIDGLSASTIKLEQKFLVMLAQKKYAKAAQIMEEVYNKNPTEKYAKKLSYLYEKSHNKTKLASLYEREYLRKKNPEYLRKLLYLYKTPRQPWLEKYFPYTGLNDTEQYVFLMKLLKKTKQHAGKIKIGTILKKMETLKNLESKQKESLSYQYAQQGEDDKAIAILESLNEISPKRKYVKKLLHLYSQNSAYNEKKEKLALSWLPDRCKKEDVLLLLAIKPRSSKMVAALEKYLPFSCLPFKKQRNALGEMLHEKIASKNPIEVKAWSNRLLKRHKQIPQKTLFYLAEKLRQAKYYKLSTKYVKHISSYRKDKCYRLLAENAYSNQSYQSALKYFTKLYRLKPESDIAVKIAELALQLDDKPTALKYFTKALKKKSNQNLLIRTALLAHELKKNKLSQRLIHRIKKPTKKNAVSFYLLQAELAEIRGEHEKSIGNYQQVLTYDRYHQMALYHLAVLYEKKNKYKKAITYMKQLLSLVKDKAKYYAQIGYWAQKYHDDNEAYDAFEKALKYDQNPQYYIAFGYSAANLKKRKIALSSFKSALDLGDDTMTYKQKYQLKESIKYMEDEFTGYFALVSNAQESINTLSSLNSDALGGYATVRFSYVPQKYDKKLQVYVNNSVALKKKSIQASKESYQPSIGVSYQPSKDTSVIIAVEALVKGGERSRDDVMARISGKFFDTYSFKAGETNYWYKSLYMDFAYFFSANSYRFYGRYEYGYVHKINQQNAFMPYAGFVAAVNNDNVAKKLNYQYDLALGLSYLFWLDESKYRSHEYTGRMSLEGRTPLKTTLDNSEQLQLMMEILF
jgi:predicted Zn-dependent protease